MRNLLEFILNRLVEFPEDVKVEELQDGELNIFRIHVNDADMGRVIGKNGSVINAIRAIAKVRAIKENLRVKVELAESENSTHAAQAAEVATEEVATEETAQSEEVVE